MEKYKVWMVHKDTGDVEDDCVDDKIFDSESEADEYASYMRSCVTEGAEVLRLSNPFDYEDEYGDEDDYEFVVVEAHRKKKR